MSMEPVNPKGLGSAELLRRIAPFGGTLSDARRIQARVIRYGDLNLRRIPQLRGTVRRAAESEFALGALRLVSRVASQEDPFVKFAFATHDGAIIEAVRIPLEKPGRFSLCLSSQAGCPLACTFCATGRMGLKRNLETWEIVDQFLQVRDDLGGAGRISGAVFMGMGEPFLNYDNVLGAAHILCEPSGGGVGAKAITICTAGVTPRIVQFTRDTLPFGLLCGNDLPQQIAAQCLAPFDLT